MIFMTDSLACCMVNYTAQVQCMNESKCHRVFEDHVLMCIACIMLMYYVKQTDINLLFHFSWFLIISNTMALNCAACSYGC